MKKMIKLMLLVMVMLGTLVACSSKKDNGKYTIAIVQPVEHPSLNTIRESIVNALNEKGISDNIEIIYKNAGGDASILPTIMQSLVNDNVDMIVPIATGTAQSALATTTSIPIVFSAVSDPILAGLVTDLNATTGNITGVSDAIAIEDIFKLALELTPNIKTFGFIYNSSEINSIAGIERAKAFCDANGLLYKEATITSTGDLQQAAQSLVDSVDAFFTPIDNTVASAMPTYIEVANKAKLPVYVSADSMVADGGLATVGIDYTILGKQTAELIYRIQQGEKISDNPVEVVSEYAKMINKNTANALGIELTDSLLETYVVIGE